MKDFLVASVDFGSKKMAASVGHNIDGELEILGSKSISSSGIEKGYVSDESKCSEALQKLLNDLKLVTKKDIREIYAGISSRGIRITEISSSVNLRNGKVSSKDILRAIERGKRNTILSEDESVVDIIINFYTLDGKVTYENVLGWMGSTLTLNLTVFIGNSNELDKYKSVIEGAGYVLKGFVVNPIVGKEIFLNEKKSVGVTTLIDIGAGVSDIVIFRNGILKYINSIPLGGNNVTKDISICGKFSIQEAEKIKKICSGNYEQLYKDKLAEEYIDVGSSRISKSLLYEVTTARLEEMLKIINEELKKTSYYEGICSIIIYGDGISYYENIYDIIKSQIKNKVKVVTKEDLGMHNPENITALAIVKEVYDRLELVYDDSMEVEEIEIVNEPLNSEKVNEKELGKKEKEERHGILRKLKSFLEDIF